LKNICLGLLLVNLLVLAWSRWVVPDVPQGNLISPQREHGLLLMSRSNDNGESDDGLAVQGGGDQAAEIRCIRVGPFAEGDVADSVGRQLSRRGFRVGRSSQEGEIWIGHWVQLENLDSIESAQAALTRLIDGGLPDAYVVQTEPTARISLGVFRNRERAENVAGIARKMNFVPVMTDRFRPGTEHWLRVDLNTDEELQLSDIQLETSQILRTENIRCGAPVSAAED